MIVITIAKKPYPTAITKNVLENGCGSINIDGCRIETSEEIKLNAKNQATRKETLSGEDRSESRQGMYSVGQVYTYKQSPNGRWPGNLILSHTPECKCVGTQKIRGTKHRNPSKKQIFCHSRTVGIKDKAAYDRTDENGMEKIPMWSCPPHCPVHILDQQSGETKGTIRQPTNKPMFGTENVSVKWNANNVMDTTVRGFADSGGASRYFKVFGDKK